MYKDLCSRYVNKLCYFFDQVTGFKDTYIFTQKFHPSHQKRAFAALTRELNEDKTVNVRFFEMSRQILCEMFILVHSFIIQVSWAEQQYVKSRQKRHIAIPPGTFIRTKRNNNILTGDNVRNWRDRTFNDELWSQEWYLVRTNLVQIYLI